MNTQEIEIPVPWGHVAAKIWGSKSDYLVLVPHGIMDNAGSFDRLIPLLPDSFCYVCIDLPGHGRSSHFPPFLPIHSINFVIVYKLMLSYFNRTKCIIMGHSYGAQIGFTFAQLYPEYVEKLIMLDTIHFFPITSGMFKDNLRDKFDSLIEFEEKRRVRNDSRPTYTYDEALAKMQDQRRTGTLTVEAAKPLLARSLSQASDGKYAFTLDHRLKYMSNPLHDFRYIIETLRKCPVRCPLLMILARDSELQQIYMKELLDVLKKYSNVKVKRVKGDHDVHNNNPEVVAPLIIDFLLRQKGKL